MSDLISEARLALKNDRIHRLVAITEEMKRNIKTGPKGGKFYISRGPKRTKVYVDITGSKTGEDLAAAGKKFYQSTKVGEIDKVLSISDPGNSVSEVIMLKNGKRKYVYTDEHKAKQAAKKFAKAIRMGKHIDATRKKISADMSSKDEKRRAAATVASLVDQHVIRAGGSEAEKKTGSVGVTTLRAEHVTVNKDGTVSLKFKGKSHKMWDVTVTDPKIVKNIKGFVKGKKPGDALFPTNRGAVNKYLKEVSPEPISMKDFRTFHASRLAHEALQNAPTPKNKKELKKNIADAVAFAASHLHHDSATCKGSYINPEVLTAYQMRFKDV